MRVTLVHEWLTNWAGSEQVVDAMREAFDQPPVYTSVFRPEVFPGWDNVHASFLQRFARGDHPQVTLAPLLPLAMTSLRLPPSDLVITSVHNFALATPVPAGTPHLVYCHTPTRFVHAGASMRDERGRVLKRVAATLWGRIDRRLGRRGTHWIANSTFIRDRIRAAYGHDASVVHPPVDVDRFRAALGTPIEDTFLCAGRLVPYKRAEAAVRCCTELGLPLLVVGEGRQRPALEAIAGPSVRFAGRVGNEELVRLMASARALIFPGIEDFGITPVEAMATGTPVIAPRAGGVLDTVEHGLSGILYDPDRADGLSAALRDADATTWDRAAISASVERFARPRFVREMQDQAAEATGSRGR